MGYNMRTETTGNQTRRQDQSSIKAIDICHRSFHAQRHDSYITTWYENPEDHKSQAHLL